MTLALFGSWQTVAYDVPAVVDGVIPLNEHGNVEVWGGDERFVPRGARLVTVELAVQAAKKLGIQHAAVLIWNTPSV